MFELVIFLHVFMVISVTANPLQGFQSCPVIQLQQNYPISTRNVQQPIVIQPSDYYLRQPSVQNQLALHSIPLSYEDYTKRFYLNNILSNQRMPLVIDSKIGTDNHNDFQNMRNDLKPTVSSPYVTKKHAIEPQDYVYENNTISHNNEPHSDQNKLDKNPVNFNKSDDSVSTKKKEKKKRKNNQIPKKRDSISRSDKRGDNNSSNNESDKNVRKSSEKSQKKKNTQKSVSKDEAKNNIPDDNIKKPTNEHPKSKKLPKSKKILQIKDTNDENEVPKKNEVSAMVKNKSKSQVDLKERNHYNSQKLENNNCFDVNEDCTELENRNIRHYRTNTNKNVQYQFPFDYSINNIASYINNLMSDPELYSNMFYNFDHLYQLPYFQPMIISQEENQKSNKGTSKRRRKKKKSKNDISNGNNKSPPESNLKNCNEVNELSPKFVEVDKNNEPIMFKLTNVEHNDEKQCTVENSQNDLNIVSELDESHFNSEVHSLNIDKIGYEDYIPFNSNNGLIDDYYPDFTADSFYNSKENHDWDSFHDRHYYTSDAMNKMDGEGKTYEHDNKNSERKDYYSKDNNGQGEIVQKITDDIKKGETMQKDRISTTSAESVRFRTPPRLEYPDFKTEKLNKVETDIRPEVHYYPSNLDSKDIILENSNEDIEFEMFPFYNEIVNTDLYNPISEMNYEPSNKIVKEYEGNKMSTYSNVKTPTLVAQSKNLANHNDIETIFAQSKVVKYSPTQEQELETADDSKENQVEEKNLISHDGNIYVVIAKSIPNDLY